MNLPQQAASAAERAANAAMYGGGAGTLVSGGAHFMGLTTDQWAIVGAVGGLVIAFLGLMVSTYFKWRHLQLAEKLGRPGGDA